MAKTKTKTSKKKVDLKNLPINELNILLGNTQKELMDFKMEMKIGKLKDVHAVKKKRKEIARIKTIVREKELEAISNE